MSWSLQLYNLNISRPGVLPQAFLSRPNAYYMRAERPKVIYNNATQQYVMWMYADNFDRTLRMAGVATSCWPSGPFTFQHVVLPDRSEETTDLTLFQNATGAAFLARTYYTNKTYSMPRPIMQPTWESVKRVGSTHARPVIDFAMNYHRAYYDVGYDNIDDIYTQRWRLEDQEWVIVIGDVVETYDTSAAKFVLTNLRTSQVLAVSEPKLRQQAISRFTDPTAKREILGQA
jgi:hypothetical protein